MSEKTQWVNNEIVDITTKDEITWLKLKRNDGTTFPLKLLKGFHHGSIGDIFRAGNIVDRGKYKEQIGEAMHGDSTYVPAGGNAKDIQRVSIETVNTGKTEAELPKVQESSDKGVDTVILGVMLEVWKSEHRKTDVPDIKFVAEQTASIIKATKEMQ